MKRHLAASVFLSLFGLAATVAAEAAESRGTREWQLRIGDADSRARHLEYGRATLVSSRRRDSEPALARDSRLAETDLVVVAVDAAGRELARRTVHDPRILRAEVADEGRLRGARVLLRTSAIFVVALPDDPRIRQLLLYHPRWNGWAFDLVEVASLPVGNPTARAASAEPVTVIRETGPSTRRVDLVILGDGYTAAERGKYATDVAELVDRFFAEPPFDAYAPYFNVRRVDVASAQSGADHPEAPEPVFRDTAFDATYDCAGIDRLICVDIGKVTTVLASSGIVASKQDVIWVLVNDTTFGGSGGTVAVGSTHASAVDLMLHESGHSFGWLADEYDDSPPPCNNSFEPWEVNVTRETARDAVKWGVWIDPATPLPTNDTALGIPGLYEGGNYCLTGIYRPTFDSKMRHLDRPFEPINEEELVRRIYNFVSPIDSQTPTATKVTARRGVKKTFSVTTPPSNGPALSLRWSVDGVAKPEWGGLTKITLQTAGLAKGKHTLRVEAQDPTDKVRSDDRHLLEAAVIWTLTIR